ncbi:DUF4007 family protein [Candidatus Poribacteria bacterium]|nr:DUF4007 family protein [Candidatus Poribacteria bacterium]
MVSSIRHWCSVARLIKTDSGQRGKLVPTEFGKVIFNSKDGLDPYLEDPATLWLIHWQIATNINQATTWYWVFNILRKNRFSLDILKKELYEWAQRTYEDRQQTGKKLRTFSDNTFQRDVNCFIRTYCQSRHNHGIIEESFDSPLVELNLITELPDSNEYEFQRGKKETLPVEVVAATLDAFWTLRFPKRDTLPFSELMYASLSPGRIFRLDEDTMTTYLEDLAQHTDRALQYDETAGLKQVYRDEGLNLNTMELLKRYYG